MGDIAARRQQRLGGRGWLGQAAPALVAVHVTVLAPAASPDLLPLPEAQTRGIDKSPQELRVRLPNLFNPVFPFFHQLLWEYLILRF